MANAHNFIEDQLVILPKQTLDVFMKSGNFVELLALYTFYYYTAKWQGTNQPKCTTAYTASGLGWGEPKVRKFKKMLIAYGLIEDMQTMDERHRVSGHYIKINYIFKQENAENVPECDTCHTEENATGAENDTVAIDTPNALSSVKRNALSSVKRNALSSVNEMLNKRARGDTTTSTKERRETRYADSDALNAAIHDFIDFRRSIKKPMTDRAIELLLKNLNALANDVDEKIEILNQSIVNGWQGIFPLKRVDRTGFVPKSSATAQSTADFYLEELRREEEREAREAQGKECFT